MKNLFKAALLFVIGVSSFQAVAQEKIIQFNELPKAAQTFVGKYYKGDVVSYVKSEKELLGGTEYSLKLQSGVELDFDKNGNWNEIDAKHKSVPSNLVPEAIKNYVQKSFPNNKIVQISKKSRYIEVELSSGLDLQFKKNGQFIKVDD